ncbi:MAG: hypothetical protein ACPF9D_10665, partial [Owenweeksia sp.]
IGASEKESCEVIHQLWDSHMDLYAAQQTEQLVVELALTEAAIEDLKTQLEHKKPEGYIREATFEKQAYYNARVLALEKKKGDQTEFLESLKEEKRELQAKLSSRKMVDEESPVAKSTMDTRKAVLGSFFGMMVIEGSVTYSAVENLAILPSIGIIVFVLLYGSLVGALCHLSGHYYALRKYRQSLMSAAGAYLLALAIILLRGYAQDEAYDWVLNLINMVFVTACILISCRLHETREYWRIKESLARCISRLDKLKGSLKLTPAEKQSILKNQQSEAESKGLKRKRADEKDLAQHRGKFSQLQTRLANIRLRIAANRKEGHFAIEQSFQDGQNT